jgi:hypothetical protein
VTPLNQAAAVAPLWRAHTYLVGTVGLGDGLGTSGDTLGDGLGLSSSGDVLGEGLGTSGDAEGDGLGSSGETLGDGEGGGCARIQTEQHTM